MTEVAQVMAVDMQDVSTEDVHKSCEEENEDSDNAQEDGTSTEKPCVPSEEAKGDRRTRRTRVRNKENEEEAVNGVAQDEDQNASELMLKKEVSETPHSIQLILS